jgi:hypothetical protein
MMRKDRHKGSPEARAAESARLRALRAGRAVVRLEPDADISEAVIAESMAVAASSALLREEDAARSRCPRTALSLRASPTPPRAATVTAWRTAPPPRAEPTGSVGSSTTRNWACSTPPTRGQLTTRCRTAVLSSTSSGCRWRTGLHARLLLWPRCVAKGSTLPPCSRRGDWRPSSRPSPCVQQNATMGGSPEGW